jgi:Glu-tRNA(Gln) amidotransferase subunit E-like FAD-binding protein
VIKKIVEKNPKAPMGALMGMCMKELAGKASGKFISSELQKIMAKGHK